MKLKEKLKNVWSKMCGKPSDCECDNHSECEKSKKDSADSESAEEVLREEIFPSGKRGCVKNLNSHLRTPDNKLGKVNGKKPSERTRPTNDNYEMIDVDEDTADANKS